MGERHGTSRKQIYQLNLEQNPDDTDWIYMGFEMGIMYETVAELYKK